MNKNFLHRHTNRLIKIATNVAKSNEINEIPYPKIMNSKHEYESYMKHLLNFIDKPELYSFVKRDNNFSTLNINKNIFPKINKSYYNF